MKIEQIKLGLKNELSKLHNPEECYFDEVKVEKLKFSDSYRFSTYINNNSVGEICSITLSRDIVEHMKTEYTVFLLSNFFRAVITNTTDMSMENNHRNRNGK